MIDQMFAKRVADRDARQRALAELRDVQKTKRGLSALSEAESRVTLPTPNDPASAVWEGIRQNLAGHLKRAQNNLGDPDVALNAVIGVLQREYDTSVKHAVRRIQ
jgi:hypothetical protein